MKQNKLNTLNISSKAIDILKDSDFLRLFKYFILIYGENKKSDSNIFLLLESFSRKDFLEHFQNKNDNNLFNQFYKFFSDDLNKIVFFDTLREFDIDEKKLNLFLNIGEYLQEVGDKQKDYPKGFYNASEEYKKGIGEIIKDREINYNSSLLLQKGYSNISPFGIIISECDFGNSIEYNSLDGGYSFVWCVDEEKNIFYQNTSGEILRDSDNKIITHIDVSSIKYFGDYRIFSFINEDGEGKIQIDNSLSLGVNFESNMFGDSFNVKDIGYTEEVFKDDGEVINKQEVLNYLLINTEEKRLLLDEELNEISILDLIEFLHKNNPLIKDNIEDDLGELGEYSISSINKIYNLNGIKLVELEAVIDIDLGNDEVESELKHFVLLDNGGLLVDENSFGENYIYSLGDNKIFHSKEFVSFSLTKMGGIDGYIDAFGKVVTIKGNKLLTIDFLSEIEGKEVYVINKKESKISDKDLILTEDELIKELEKYNGFNENDFEIIIDGKKIITSDEIDLKINEILGNKKI